MRPLSEIFEPDDLDDEYDTDTPSPAAACGGSLTPSAAARTGEGGHPPGAPALVGAYLRAWEAARSRRYPRLLVGGLLIEQGADGWACVDLLYAQATLGHPGRAGLLHELARRLEACDSCGRPCPVVWLDDGSHDRACSLECVSSSSWEAVA